MSLYQPTILDGSLVTLPVLSVSLGMQLITTSLVFQLSKRYVLHGVDDGSIILRGVENTGYSLRGVENTGYSLEGD